MHCYFCGPSSLTSRKGKVRDNPNLRILECSNCGLVFLNDFKHITDDFYKKSGMHGVEKVSMEDWLAETAEDDERRFKTFKNFFKKKTLLDFGCGAGGFLLRAENYAQKVCGIELEARVLSYWAGKFDIYDCLEKLRKNFDIITAFHVIEHLPDPIKTLKCLGKKLNKNGKIIIEVPNSEDALLTLYDCEDFQNFTYWSQHLYLFSMPTLLKLIDLAGFKPIFIDHVQRYPISNHLYWLSQGLPGGHLKWPFLNSLELSGAYSKNLAKIGKTDTLIAVIEKI